MSAPALPDFDRQKWIVIHGWGGTYAEALLTLDGILDFEAVWIDGAFYLPRRSGMVIRQILDEPEPNEIFQAFQALVISRFLVCSTTPSRIDPEEKERRLRLSEARILQNFEALGLPLGAEARHRRAAQLTADARLRLANVMPTIASLKDELWGHNAPRLPEADARECIVKATATPDTPEGLLPLLESIRSMLETGGDLDTVCSATFYAHWLTHAAKQEGRSFVYGKDYRFVFVNYHEGLRHLPADGGADICIADLPIGALPAFDRDVAFLARRDVRILRFEDHHPYDDGQIDMLARLERDGDIGTLAMSGPLQGSELAPEDQKCAGDMVFESTVEGQPWETEGTRTLRRATHGEDLVTNRTDLGRLLSDLIKGGLCKVELAQLLLAALPGNDFIDRIEARGWGDIRRHWRAAFLDVEDKLRENAFFISIARRSGAPADQGGTALGEGSDMPAPRRGPEDDTVRLLVALAMRSEPGKPRLPIGRAVEYYTATFPEADYLFYAYGASMLVARRLNQADLTFNLGELMPLLGNTGDGGHAGAAVCRPVSNPDYPQRLLGRVTPANFKAYVRYLAGRLEDLGHEVRGVDNRSKASQEDQRGGRRKLIGIMLIAALAGLVLSLLLPRFRPSAIRASNKDFFPNISLAAPEDGPLEGTTP